jgi:hypothetical protein
MGTPSRAIAAPLIVHRPTPIIDAERLLLPPRAIGHQPPQQLGHLHVTAMPFHVIPRGWAGPSLTAR